MTVQIWEAALGAVGVAASGGAGAFFGRKSKAERSAEIARIYAEVEKKRVEAQADRESSAVMLTKAYGEFVDDLRRDVQDSREHIHRQSEELHALRAELTAVKQARDDELNALRLELASVRRELGEARTENQALRSRMAQLERRSDLAA